MLQTIINCVYCSLPVSNVPTPSANDDKAWKKLAKQHAQGCEWIDTRAHSRCQSCGVDSHASCGCSE